MSKTSTVVTKSEDGVFSGVYLFQKKRDLNCSDCLLAGVARLRFDI